MKTGPLVAGIIIVALGALIMLFGPSDRDPGTIGGAVLSIGIIITLFGYDPFD